MDTRSKTSSLPTVKPGDAYEEPYTLPAACRWGKTELIQFNVDFRPQSRYELRSLRSAKHLHAIEIPKDDPLKKGIVPQGLSDVCSHR